MSVASPYAPRRCPLPRSLRLLILGGTTESRELGRHLRRSTTVAATLSLAGRTSAPLAQAVPTRVGGFGGVEGLVDYLIDTCTEAVVDATHPFAGRISAHAATACARLALPLATFTRPAWRPTPGDRWTGVADLSAAVDALGPDPRRILLTVGRLGLSAFKAAPWHSYIGRTIDAPDPADRPPGYRAILDRGPFSIESEMALMRTEAIEVIVTKNSGGEASAAKLVAARCLGLPVVMVERPPSAAALPLTDLDSVLRWIEAQRGAP